MRITNKHAVLFTMKLDYNDTHFPLIPALQANITNSSAVLSYYSDWTFCIYFCIYLLYHQLDIWKDASHPNENVDIHVKKEEVRRAESILKSKGISFTVMIKDLQDAIMKEARSNQKVTFENRYDYNKYNEYSKVCKRFVNVL